MCDRCGVNCERWIYIKVMNGKIKSEELKWNGNIYIYIYLKVEYEKRRKEILLSMHLGRGRDEWMEEREM